MANILGVTLGVGLTGALATSLIYGYQKDAWDVQFPYENKAWRSPVVINKEAALLAIEEFSKAQDTTREPSVPVEPDIQVPENNINLQRAVEVMRTNGGIQCPAEDSKYRVTIKDKNGRERQVCILPQSSRLVSSTTNGVVESAIQVTFLPKPLPGEGPSDTVQMFSQKTAACTSGRIALEAFGQSFLTSAGINDVSVVGRYDAVSQTVCDNPHFKFKEPQIPASHIQ
jgi:hypothetical protein